MILGFSGVNFLVFLQSFEAFELSDLLRQLSFDV